MTAPCPNPQCRRPTPSGTPCSPNCARKVRLAAERAARVGPACEMCGKPLNDRQIREGGVMCSRRCSGHKHQNPRSAAFALRDICIAPVAVGHCREVPTHAERDGVPTLCDQHRDWTEAITAAPLAWARYSEDARP